MAPSWIVATSATRRDALRAALDVRRGGVIGIEAVEEIVLGASDPDASAQRWQRLFDPILPSGRHFWRLGDGPAIRIVPSPEDRVEHIVVSVRSLDATGAALVIWASGQDAIATERSSSRTRSAD